MHVHNGGQERILSYIKIETCQHLNNKEALQNFLVTNNTTNDHWRILTLLQPQTILLALMWALCGHFS